MLRIPSATGANGLKATPNAGNLPVPPARFVQWKAVLRDEVSIASIGLNYLPVNVAPSVDELVVQPGARVNSTVQAATTGADREHQLSFGSEQRD